MTASKTFVIDGPPVGKERARTVRTKRGDVRSFTPSKTKHYEQRVRMTAKVALGRRWDRTGRFALSLEVYHGTGVFPDVDNVLKSVMDGCALVAWDNDKQVWLVHAERHFGGPPRVEVTIWRQDGDSE